MVWKLTDGADFYRILEQREFIAFLLARAQRWEEGGGSNLGSRITSPHPPVTRNARGRQDDPNHSKVTDLHFPTAEL